jgi:hypothetical protein
MIIQVLFPSSSCSRNSPIKKTSPLILILAITLGTYLNDSTLDAADNPKASVFKHLKKGQIVTLKDNGHNYSIQVLPNLPIGHKIVEIGSDYLVIEDAASAFTFYIPVTSIKAISFLNGKFGIEK